MKGFATSSIWLVGWLSFSPPAPSSPPLPRSPQENRFSSPTPKDGKPLQIKPEYFDTEQSRKYLESGKNPYVGDKATIDRGKKVFQLYSCTQCHGGSAQGQTGPGLTGPNFKYAKNTTDKGMFETIWAGSKGKCPWTRPAPAG